LLLSLSIGSIAVLNIDYVLLHGSRWYELQAHTSGGEVDPKDLKAMINCSVYKIINWPFENGIT